PEPTVPLAATIGTDPRLLSSFAEQVLAWRATPDRPAPPVKESVSLSARTVVEVHRGRCFDRAGDTIDLAIEVQVAHGEGMRNNLQNRDAHPRVGQGSGCLSLWYTLLS